MSLTKSLTRLLTIAALSCLANIASAQLLQSTGQPANQIFDNQTATYSLDLSQYLSVPGVTGQIVLMESDFGVIPFEMLPQAAPKTVANFLTYVDDLSYDATIFHRSIPGFIIQGGGFKENVTTITEVTSKPAVINEFLLSNTRGTVAMAKLGTNPNSATNEWFINLADNSANLNNQNGGFTVFARVIGTGMAVADTIEKLPRYTFGAQTPWTDIPLERILSSAATDADLVAVKTARRADLFPTADSPNSFVNYTAITSSNPGVATASLGSISGSQLTLQLGIGATGSTVIAITAEDPNGNEVELTFTLTLEAAFVTLDSESKSTGYLQSSYTLDLDSNTAWGVGELPDWITLSQTSGDGPATLTVNVAANDTLLPRTASFSIYGQSHTIYQYANFNAWLATHFSAPQIEAMTPNPFDADSDGDGLSNGIENALGLDPTNFNSQLRTRFSLSERSLSLSPVRPGLTAELQSSPNLIDWTKVENVLGALGQTPDSVTYHLPDNADPFYQLKLTNIFFTPFAE